MRKTIALALAAAGFVAFTASANACPMMKTAKTDTTTTVATTGGQTSIPKTGS